MKVVKRALIENPHIEGVFWDVRARTPEPSQHPPTTPLLSFLLGILLPLRCPQLALLTSHTPWQYPSLYQHSPDGLTKRAPKHAAAFKNALVVSDVSMHASLSCCERLASGGSNSCGV